MTGQQRKELRALEGRTVHVALADGSRIDDADLVSAGTRTLWVFTAGRDEFVALENVLEVWEARPLRPAA